MGWASHAPRISKVTEGHHSNRSGAVDNYSPGLSTGVVTENMGFAGTSVAHKTRAVSRFLADPCL